MGLMQKVIGSGARRIKFPRYNLGVEKDKWNENVNHPLQSWEWGEFRKQRQEISRLNNFTVIWSKIPYTPFCFGYIPMSRMPNEKEIKLLSEEAIKHKAIGIRLEPISGTTKLLKPGRNLFKKKTLIWNLKQTEEELLKNMHSKGRYNIKVAQRHGVEIKENNSEKALNRYLELMFEGTAKRQGIYSHGKIYHRLLWNSLKDNIAHMFVAKYKDIVIATAIIFKFKNNIYYAYGASALEHKEVMAPTLLLWEIAKWGKREGCEYFDLWGAEEGKGFTRFKEQFGATEVELPGSFDLPVNNWLYPLFRVMEELRWKILRILK